MMNRYKRYILFDIILIEVVLSVFIFCESIYHHKYGYKFYILLGLMIIIMVLIGVDQVRFLIGDTAFKLYMNESIERERIEKMHIFFLKHMCWYDYFRKSVILRVKKLENDDWTYLGPIDELDYNNVYIKKLSQAYFDKRIKNIGLIGSYGVGKSSIIESFIKKYPHYCSDKKVIKISFPKFFEKKIVDGESISTEKLESAILEQLFYKVKQTTIPKSRYRRIIEISRSKKIVIFLLISMVLYFVAFFNSTMIKELFEINNNNNFFQPIKTVVEIFTNDKAIVKKSLLSLVGIGLIAYIVYNIVIKIGTFNFSFNFGENISVESEEKKSELDSESIFDVNMDEIIYFFKKTKYDTIFIEDLDRFNNIEIFESLRYLNQILNNSKDIGRRIIFIYATKEDIFKGENSKVKFFDYIIPVAPVIDNINNKEMWIKKLQFVRDKNNELESKYGVDYSFLVGIVRYINDARTLINICNEFFVYYELTKSDLNAKYKFDYNKIFALVVLKNMCSKEFYELINGEENELSRAIDKKRIFIRGKIEELEKEKIDYENDTRVVEEKKRQIRLLEDGIIEEFSYECYGENISDKLNNELLTYMVLNGCLDADYLEYIRHYKINNIAVRRDDRYFIDYVQRKYRSVDEEYNKLKHEKEKKQKRIEQLEQKMEEIKDEDKPEIYDSFHETYVINPIYSERTKEYVKEIEEINNEIEVIDDKLYHSSNDEIKALVSTNRESFYDLDFDYRLFDVEDVIDTLDERYFMSDRILNYDIMDYLLAEQCVYVKSKYKNKMHNLIKHLLSKNDKDVNGNICFRFIVMYLKRLIAVRNKAYVHYKDRYKDNVPLTVFLRLHDELKENELVKFLSSKEYKVKYINKEIEAWFKLIEYKKISQSFIKKISSEYFNIWYDIEESKYFTNAEKKDICIDILQCVEWDTIKEIDACSKGVFMKFVCSNKDYIKKSELEYERKKQIWRELWDDNVFGNDCEMKIDIVDGTILFGTYPQTRCLTEDNDIKYNTEPIKWVRFKEYDEKTIFISKNNLDVSDGDIKEKRERSEFLNTLFDEQEQKILNNMIVFDNKNYNLEKIVFFDIDKMYYFEDAIYYENDKYFKDDSYSVIEKFTPIYTEYAEDEMKKIREYRRKNLPLFPKIIKSVRPIIAIKKSDLNEV